MIRGLGDETFSAYSQTLNGQEMQKLGKVKFLFFLVWISLGRGEESARVGLSSFFHTKYQSDCEGVI